MEPTEQATGQGSTYIPLETALRRSGQRMRARIDNGATQSDAWYAEAKRLARVLVAVNAAVRMHDCSRCQYAQKIVSTGLLA